MSKTNSGGLPAETAAGSETKSTVSSATEGQGQPAKTTTLVSDRASRVSTIAKWLTPPVTPGSAAPAGAGGQSEDDGTQSTDGESGTDPNVHSQPGDSAAHEPAEPNVDPEGDTDPDDENEDGQAKTGEAPPKWWNKKLKKFKDKARDADAKVQELSQRLDQLQRQSEQAQATRPQANQPRTGSDPFETEVNPTVIQQKGREAENAVTEVERLIEAMQIDPDSVAETLTQWGVKARDESGEPDRKAMYGYLSKIRDNARSVAAAAPQRMKFLEDERRHLNAIVAQHPELSEPGSKLFKTVNQVVTEYPALRSRPDWPIQATIYALGKAEYDRQRAAAGKPAPAAPARRQPAPPPKVPGAPRSAPPAEAGAEADEGVRRTALSPGAGREQRVAYIKRQLTKTS